jgi:hypothetical protein
MDIIFAFIIFYFSSELQFKFELSEEIQLNELNSTDIPNTLRNVPKLNMLVQRMYEHSTTSLGENEKTNKLWRVSGEDTRQRCSLSSVS